MPSFLFHGLEHRTNYFLVVCVAFLLVVVQVGREQIKPIKRQKGRGRYRYQDIMNGVSNYTELRGTPEQEIRKKLNFQKLVVTAFESPKSKYVPLPVGCHMFIQKENGELEVVPIPGIQCSWLRSREKELLFQSLYVSNS